MATSRSLTRLRGPVVIDASVAVEYLIRSALTPHAQALLRSVVDHDVELWAPALLYPESVSALRKLSRLRAITTTEAHQAVEDLCRLPITTTGTRDLMARAWALREAVTAYDACYTALAEALGAPFVTADQRLTRALRGIGADGIYLGTLSRA
ncbi:MAG: type II toxin-antitoxin system VapC family toxin [Candidatus Rokuibacteriota bacterium]